MNRNIFSKIIDIICFVGGTFLFVYNLFGFHTGRGDYAYYYYNDNQEYMLAIGMALIILGFLIRSWKK